MGRTGPCDSLQMGGAGGVEEEGVCIKRERDRDRESEIGRDREREIRGERQKERESGCL